jgi:hypothetical protein
MSLAFGTLCSSQGAFSAPPGSVRSAEGFRYHDLGPATLTRRGDEPPWSRPKGRLVELDQNRER